MNPLFGPAFGLLMVVAAGATGGPVVLAVLGLAVIAVAAGLADRRAAAAAVLLSITALALSDPAPLFAAVSGMSAAAYLVISHAAGRNAVTMTVPMVAGLLGFTAAGLAATAVALPVSWIPLLAPAIIAAVLIVVAIPLLADDRTGDIAGPASDHQLPGRYE
ncbi:MAG: hypothetical protein WCP30_08215 [Mycobacteriaceae bacterium]